MEIILTFDVGTTSMKCCAFDTDFNVIEKTVTEYSLQTRGEHMVEADPEIYFDGLIKSISLMKEKGVDLSDVAAIGMTTQGETTVALGRDGKPVRNAIVWLDDRASDEAEELSREIPSDVFFRRTGMPEIGGALPLSKLKMLMREDSDRRISKVLLLEDYLIYRLTGEYKTEHSLICSTGYYDILNRRLNGDFLSLAGADPYVLPEVGKCGDVAGLVTTDAARLCGIKAGTPVVLTAMDQTCSAIGAGNVEEGVVSETTGTCLTVLSTVKRPDLTKPGPLQFYTHYDDSFLALAYDPTAALLIKWLKDEFIKDTDGCKSSPLNAYDYMSSLAEKVPAGCDGLLALPQFAGKNVPDFCPDMRGTFYGLSVNTTKGHFIRAIMEGVAFMLRENLDCLEKSGIAAREIRSLGGGSRDLLWTKIKASVTGKKLVTLENEESTSLGAAILAAKGVGMINDVPSAAEKAVRTRDAFLPDERERNIYDETYAKYLRLDRAIRGFVGRSDF